MKQLRLTFGILLMLGGCVSTPKPRMEEAVALGSGWRSERRSFQDCMSGPDVTQNFPGSTGFMECSSHDYDFDKDVDLSDYAFWASLDPDRNADSPSNWLVLYNRNNPESEQWKNWYISRWGIPPENAFGLDVSNEEKITVDDYFFRIHQPIQMYLKTHPDLHRKIITE